MAENIQWYRKNRSTVSSKLRQVILDALPLDLTAKQADVILHAIFDKIADEGKKGGYVTITGFGRFQKRRRPGKWKPKAISTGKGKLINIGMYWEPEKYLLGFVANPSLLKAMRETEPDGNTGTE